MILSWNTTKRCNLYCKHCYRESDEKAAENELTLSEGKALIDAIQKTGKFRIIILSGGEPLLRDDLEEIAQYVKTKGMIPVLGTNGTLLTKERAKSLKEAGVAAVGISIDSIESSKHNAFRQTPDAYEGARQGIENAIEAGLRVQINPTITKDNVHEIEAIIEQAESWGASSVHPFFLVEAGRGKCIKENALSDEGYFEALKRVLELQPNTNVELKPTCAPQFMSLAKEMGIPNRFTRGCLAGLSYCCILPDGKVHVCPYMPLEAGDVRKQTFDEIWKSSPVFKALRDFSNYEGRCGSCADMDICGGCRARAYYQSGHYLGEDPMSKYCYKKREEKS
jgi:MoaA/NifB/PqqE/SkfB family radical SAM enzyme